MSKDKIDELQAAVDDGHALTVVDGIVGQNANIDEYGLLNEEQDNDPYYANTIDYENGAEEDQEAEMIGGKY